MVATGSTYVLKQFHTDASIPFFVIYFALLENSCPPKAEVRGSNPFGRAMTSRPYNPLSWL